MFDTLITLPYSTLPFIAFPTSPTNLILHPNLIWPNYQTYTFPTILRTPTPNSGSYTVIRCMGGVLTIDGGGINLRAERAKKCSQPSCGGGWFLQLDSWSLHIKQQLTRTFWLIGDWETQEHSPPHTPPARQNWGGVEQKQVVCASS